MKITPFQLNIEPARCTGCGCCVAACRRRLFSLDTAGHRKFAVAASLELCSRCLECVTECRVAAITATEGAVV